MKKARITIYRILALTLLFVLGSVVGIQPVAAQGTSEGEPSLTIQIVPEQASFSAANLATPPVFDVGDRFKVSVLALGIDDPGVFGSQFEIHFDPTYLTIVEDTLVSGTEMEPVINPVNVVDNDNGWAHFAASRQGNVANLTGTIVLATVSFEAVAATEPPEGQTTLIDLQNVKLGAKGGIDVPVSGIVDLEVIIRGEDSPGAGDIVGLVAVEGRAEDNQADHEVTAVGSDDTVWSGTTAFDGFFWLDEVPGDTYTVTASRAGFLTATCTDVSHAEATLTELAEVTLLAGDLNGDDLIDITDAVAIGTALGEVTDEQVADLNADVQVDVLDLILMAVNYGQTADDNPWACQLAVEL